MPLSSKFLPESTGEKLVNIQQRYGKSLMAYFFGPPCSCHCSSVN